MGLFFYESIYIVSFHTLVASTKLRGAKISFWGDSGYLVTPGAGGFLGRGILSLLKISLVPLVCSFVQVCLHYGNT